MRRFALAGAFGIVVGCGSPQDVVLPDGGSSDAVDSPGLYLQMRPQPGLPSMLTESLSVSEFELFLEDVRIVGDSADGDDQTRVSKLSWSWPADNDRPPEHFPGAPSGVYSRVRARVESFAFRGDIGGAPFEIAGPGEFDIDFEPLEPGKNLLIIQYLTFGEALLTLNTAALQENNEGVLALEMDSEEWFSFLDAFKDALEGEDDESEDPDSE